MNRQAFLKTALLLGTGPFFSKLGFSSTHQKKISIRLLRHATLVVQIDDLKILVDPLFAPKNSLSPITTFGERNNVRNPMVDLPISNEELVKLLDEIDVVLVTHTHTDHWDKEAVKMIDKAKTLFCQPADLPMMKKSGFINAASIEKEISWKNIRIVRTNGQHGTGNIAKAMAPVSGFIIETADKKIYIAGDTIWCTDVKQVIDQYQPNYIVVNAGGAQFKSGAPITMTPADVVSVCGAATAAKVIAVHMDTVNHCHATRPVLADYLRNSNLLHRVTIPADGETISI